MAHVAEWKHGEVKELIDLLIKNKVIGIVEIGGIPAPQMQQMRNNIHKIATLRSAKNKLIFRAIDEAEKSIINNIVNYVTFAISKGLFNKIINPAPPD